VIVRADSSDLICEDGFTHIDAHCKNSLVVAAENAERRIEQCIWRSLRPLAAHREQVWSRLLGLKAHVLDFIVHEPLEEGFVVFGELDFGLVFGVER